MFKVFSVHKTLIWTALMTGFFLLGCSSTSELISEDHVDENAIVDYSVIYYIHADSDYLYHDEEGNPVRGNSKVLDTALKVANEALSGEVFVFYQQPRKRLMGIFPRRSSRLYHYKNGELTNQVKYRHSNTNEEFLTTEARLFNQYQTQSGIKDRRNYFLYFGHEIPEGEGKKYHRTNPNITVNVESFSGGIQKFLGTDGQRYNLVVLSTCNNGTPVMADHLMPISDVLLASPQNLHLSHIDSKNMSLIERNPEIPTVQLAHAMADRTFYRLRSNINTAITLTVYDFEILQKQQNELRAFSKKYLASNTKQHVADNVDCAEATFFDRDIFGKGLITLYRPAKFGRRANSAIHSGWGCKPLAEN